MSMSRKSRKELAKARELLWHFLDGKNCCFCHLPLVEGKQVRRIRFGDATGEPLPLGDITLHHEDGNHKNNERSNRKLSHFSCHKRYHAKLVFRAWRAEQEGAA